MMLLNFGLEFRLEFVAACNCLTQVAINSGSTVLVLVMKYSITEYLSKEVTSLFCIVAINRSEGQ